MKEMTQIEKYVANVHKKFMNNKSTTEELMMRDLWFAMNLLTLSYNNLRRWSKTTQTPDKAFKNMIKAHLKKLSIKI